MIKILSDLLYGYALLDNKAVNDLNTSECGLILLPENPNSSYRWRYNISDNNIINLQSKIELFINKENVCGRKKIILFVFKPLSEGICTISFKKYKSWENYSYYIEESSYFIVVNKPGN